MKRTFFAQSVLVLFVLLFTAPMPVAQAAPARPEPRPSPLALSLPAAYSSTMLAAGGFHTCALTTAGGVKCWGRNGNGQLGNNTTAESHLPVDVRDLTSGVSVIAAGGWHTCALTTGGGVKCWGRNDYGQLGNGLNVDSSVPVDVSGLTSGVTAIKAGAFHTCALTTAGEVKCWGGNDFGQLGNSTYVLSLTPVDVSGLTGGVQAITIGYQQTCALTTAGGVKCWGLNDDGQLGNNTTTSSPIPVDVSGLTGEVSAVEAGAWHTCALTTSGGMKCWGNNTWGQLGDNTTTPSLIPVDVSGLTSGVSAITVGYQQTCALTSAGGMMCWGFNDLGQLGYNNTLANSPIPVDVSGLTGGVSAIEAGGYHTCALTTRGGAKCWGNNENGQLGNNSTTHSFVPGDVSGLNNGVSAIEAGGLYTCALTTSGGVKCWGDNQQGQLGNNSTTDSLVPVDVSGLTNGVSAISTSDYHTCALTTSGGVLCWGDNSSGQLGNNTITDSLVPVPVSGLTSGVSAIALGYRHSCALTTSGAVLCWGDNSSGQLGNNTTTPRLVPVPVSSLGSGVSAIASRLHHTCALTTSGAVLCWGYNAYGQLGNNTTTDSLVPVPVSSLGSGVSAIALGYYHTCALTTSGAVLCWGLNNNGQLGNNTTTPSFVPAPVSGLTSGVSAIEAGVFYTCALTSSGGVKCWGENDGGQFGNNTTTGSLIPADASGLSSGVSHIAAGYQHTCAVTAGCGVLCWGRNGDGQLGDNSITNRLSYTQTSGLLSTVFPTARFSLNPSVFGQTVQFTANTAGGVGTPGGEVQFTVDGVNSGAPVALANGNAAFSTAGLLPGAHLVQAIYSGDANFWPGASAGIVQAVSKGTPEITWSNPEDIVYGAALGSTQLNATTGIPGSFTYTPPVGTLLNAGDHTLRVDFTPEDSDNYTPAFKEVTLTVLKAEPVITWADPADIHYGMPLSATQLNASSNVPGTLTYTPAAGALLSAGSHTLRVDFTPADLINYEPTFKGVTIQVIPWYYINLPLIRH